MSTGSVGWWVICLYLRSVGLFLSVSIVISLILMQLSQNYTFLWLTFWIKNRATNSTTLNSNTLLESPHETQTVMDHGFNIMDNVIHRILNGSLPVFHNTELVTKSPNIPDLQLTVRYDDNFYLEMYFVLAGLNLLFTVMRAFLFAYGGVKAAGRIHRILVNVIMRVSWSFLYPFSITCEMK